MRLQSLKYESVYLLLFGMGIIYSFDKLIKSAGPQLESLALLIVFVSLFFFSWFNWYRFRIRLGEDGIAIEQLFRPKRMLPYDLVLAVYTHKNIMDSVLGLRSLVIKFNLPREEGEVAFVKVFGLRVPYYWQKDFPSLNGELLNVPGVSDKNMEIFRSDLSNRIGRKLEVSNLGYGFPRHNKAVLVSSYALRAMIVFLMIIFALSWLVALILT